MFLPSIPINVLLKHNNSENTLKRVIYGNKI